MPSTSSLPPAASFNLSSRLFFSLSTTMAGEAISAVASHTGLLSYTARLTEDIATAPSLYPLSQGMHYVFQAHARI